MLKHRDYHLKETDMVTNADHIDRKTFSRSVKKSKMLQEVASQGKSSLDTFMPLMGDLYASLYKARPELKDDGDKSSPNREFVERVMNLDGFNQYRESTKLDSFTSALGSAKYGKTIYEWVEEEREKNEDADQDFRDAENAARDAEQAQNKADQASSEEEKTEAQSKADQAKKQAHNSMKQALEKLIQGSGGKDLQKGLEKAQKEAKTSADDVKELLKGSSNSASDKAFEQMPLDQKLTLAESLSKSPKMKKISEWAGRFKQIARKKRKSKSRESIQRSGIVNGDLVERLLPSELMLFKKTSTKRESLRKFAEKETLMYAPKGKEQIGKGPIVICLDQSSSMIEMDIELANSFSIGCTWR